MRFLTEIRESRGAGTGERLRAALTGHKVVVVRRASHAGNGAFYQKLAGEIGDFHFRDEDPVTGRLDRTGWLDIRYDATLAATAQYRYGNGRMPLHVDGAYSDVAFDVFFLCCETPARFGGATFAVDGSLVADYLAACDPALLRSLCEVDVRFTKGERTVTRRVIDYDGAGAVLNWSSTRVAPDNPAPVIDMCARFAAFCEQRLVDGGLVTPIPLMAGDAVFMHNRRVLHGRYAFWGERCLLKGVLSLTAPVGGEVLL
ncbi:MULTISPECIES: TauD/TfdA family dioxygenase [Burkholderia]|uniref:TauD/TfdA family dioxygenase n=1 Tax=Burkholderia TaxID=32008 RepID=UPI0008415FC9|nr:MULTISPECIES: TauD/TfdA family dioxygenase [unclassified Burkholderia]AOK31658.1 hypothetical protein AQ611_19170 [Burkholderia sp. Bp7605]